MFKCKECNLEDNNINNNNKRMTVSTFTAKHFILDGAGKGGQGNLEIAFNLVSMRTF